MWICEHFIQWLFLASWLFLTDKVVVLCIHAFKTISIDFDQRKLLRKKSSPSEWEKKKQQKQVKVFHQQNFVAADVLPFASVASAGIDHHTVLFGKKWPEELLRYAPTKFCLIDISYWHPTVARHPILIDNTICFPLASKCKFFYWVSTSWTVMSVRFWLASGINIIVTRSHVILCLTWSSVNALTS